MGNHSLNWHWMGNHSLQTVPSCQVMDGKFCDWPVCCPHLAGVPWSQGVYSWKPIHAEQKCPKIAGVPLSESPLKANFTVFFTTLLLYPYSFRHFLTVDFDSFTPVKALELTRISFSSFWLLFFLQAFDLLCGFFVKSFSMSLQKTWNSKSTYVIVCHFPVTWSISF